MEVVNDWVGRLVIISQRLNTDKTQQTDSCVLTNWLSWRICTCWSCVNNANPTGPLKTAVKLKVEFKLTLDTEFVLFSSKIKLILRFQFYTRC